MTAVMESGLITIITGFPSLFVAWTSLGKRDDSNVLVFRLFFLKSSYAEGYRRRHRSSGQNCTDPIPLRSAKLTRLDPASCRYPDELRLPPRPPAPRQPE